MKIAPYPLNEVSRLAVLQCFGILDTPPDSILDNITQTAADVCGTSMALISLIDSNRQWFKSSVGIQMQQSPRDLAFCSHAILNPYGLMEIENATLDERFCNNPLVTGEPKIRFYAGKPLVTTDGFALGTLCVIDSKPLKLSDSQKNALQRLASVSIELIREQAKCRAGANVDRFAQLILYSVNMANQYKSGANSPAQNTNPEKESKQLRRQRVLENNNDVVDNLACIVSSAIEYDLHTEPKRLINYIYFYCEYLQRARRRGVYVDEKIVQLEVVPATFFEFIFDQSLLNETATVIAYEEGEYVTAPTALEIQTQ